MKTFKTLSLAVLTALFGALSCDVTTFEPCDSEEDTDIVIETSAYVDLGLSVNWGSCNVGAAEPQQAGCYFACGEDTTRVCYSTKDYEVRPGYICFGYNSMSSKLDAVYDNLGEGWSLPSAKQIQELVDNCTVTSCRYRKTRGYAVTGPNGKSIFFPCAGYKSELDTFNNNNNPTYQAIYWHNVSGGIFYMKGNKMYTNTDSNTYLGMPVRGVYFAE